MDGWMDGYPLDCYDYQSTCGANKYIKRYQRRQLAVYSWASSKILPFCGRTKFLFKTVLRKTASLLKMVHVHNSRVNFLLLLQKSLCWKDVLVSKNSLKFIALGLSDFKFAITTVFGCQEVYHSTPNWLKFVFAPSLNTNHSNLRIIQKKSKYSQFLQSQIFI